MMKKGDEEEGESVQPEEFLRNIRNEIKKTTSDIHAKISLNIGNEHFYNSDDESEADITKAVVPSGSSSSTDVNPLEVMTAKELSESVHISLNDILPCLNEIRDRCLEVNNDTLIKVNGTETTKERTEKFKEFQLMKEKIQQGIEEAIPKMKLYSNRSQRFHTDNNEVISPRLTDSLSETDTKSISSSDIDMKKHQSEEFSSDVNESRIDLLSSNLENLSIHTNSGDLSKKKSSNNHDNFDKEQKVAEPSCSRVKDKKSNILSKEETQMKENKDTCNSTRSRRRHGRSISRSQVSPNDNSNRNDNRNRNIDKNDNHQQYLGKRDSNSMKKITDLSRETKLIITLLGLQPEQRDFYLNKIAKERNIFVRKNNNSNDCVINQSYKTVFEILKHQTIRILPENMHSNENRTNLNTTRAVRTPEKEFKENNTTQVQQRTYEEKVTRLLHDIRDRDKDVSLSSWNKDLVLESNQDLNTFLDKLCEMKVGYVVIGDIRINAKNNFEAYVGDRSNVESKDILIESVILRKTALHGDTVRVFVKNQCKIRTSSSSDELSAESTNKRLNSIGFVVEILEKKHNRKCVGTFMEGHTSNRRYLKFQPRDMKIPKLKISMQNLPATVIEQKQRKESIDKVLYLAEIIDWTNNEKPIGSIIKSIGKCDELETENLSILVQNNLDVSPYSEEIIAKLPKYPYEITAKEFAEREDIRKQCVFTIDPLTARDLDDALSLRDLSNGNYEIGVHIADVAYFLPENSELDNIVKNKATTIYMVDNVFHMLPKQLCYLCSLLPGEDKLSFSVFWEITPNGEIIKTRFARTIINSCTQFAYEHAQKMLENPTKNDWKESDFPDICNGYTISDISKIVNKLQKIALVLRNKRFENGALKIDQPKLSFQLDPVTGKPLKYSVYELKDSNRLIEDFMLLANQSVAEFIYKKYPKISILRNHSPPAPSAATNLLSLMEKLNYKFDISDSKSFGESIKMVLKDNEANIAGASAVLNILCAKPMTRAKYFCGVVIRSTSFTFDSLFSDTSAVILPKIPKISIIML